MNVQVLLSTMNQESVQFYEHVNIQTDAVIVNQTDFFGYEETTTGHNKRIQMYSFPERGVGKSRNNALMRSDAEICLMADDDMQYVDGYEELVLRAFDENPQADVLLFNVIIEKKDGVMKLRSHKKKRVRFYNCLRYGTVNIAFRREKIMKENIFFSLLFGGGAKYGSGEDTLFLTACLNKGLKIYAYPAVIAKIAYRPSTWFKGYDEKFFYDKGSLFSAISPVLAYPLSVYFLTKNVKNTKEVGMGTAIRQMLRGIKEY